MKTKVFGIGFRKTATTSLANALTHLGYRVTGPNWVDNPNIAEEVYKLAFDLANRFDAFQDNPWPILYKELDRKFPGSKFILTLRPSDEWVRSVVNHFTEEETSMRKWIYGVGRPKGNENVYLARYERHNHEVIEYFKDRGEQLLVLNITAGEGWTKLCPFLDEPIPAIPFPRANMAAVREKNDKRNKNWLWRTYFKIRRRTSRLITTSITSANC
jgi:Sulfotransferase domain